MQIRTLSTPLLTRIFPLIATVIFTLAIPPAQADWAEHDKSGLTALRDGNYAEAEKELLTAKKQAEKGGLRYGNYASTLLNLGLLYDKKNNAAESEKNYKEALSIYEKSYGVDAIQDASALHGLADLYRHNKRYKEAEPLYIRAMKIREKIAPEHPDLADTLNGLADCYRKGGKDADAVPVYTRALDIRQKSLGSNHPKTAKSLENLAAAYVANNKLEMAIPVYEKLVTARESSAGPNDEKVATALEGLASVHTMLGKYKKAEKEYKRALAIRETNGKTNAEALSTCLKDYAALLRKTGSEEEAKVLELRAKGKKAEVKKADAKKPAQAGSSK